MELNYKKYQESLQYVNAYNQRRQEIKSNRHQRKNGDYTNHVECQTMRLYNEQELYSNTKFLYDRDKVKYQYLKEYLDDLIQQIFKRTKMLRKFKEFLEKEK